MAEFPGLFSIQELRVLDVRDQLYWFRAAQRKRYEEEKRWIRIFNLAQAGGKDADQQVTRLDVELQKLDYDEAGVEPGKENEYLEGE